MDGAAAEGDAGNAVQGTLAGVAHAYGDMSNLGEASQIFHSCSLFRTQIHTFASLLNRRGTSVSPMQ